MVADRKARADLRDALVSYMRGDIRTFEFDDRNSVYFEKGLTDDRSVREIGSVLWSMHDDFIDHPISVTPEGWLFLMRVVAFLGTELELAPTARRKRLPTCWPFRDEAEWLANESTGHDTRIPEYDPDVHGRRFQPWWNRIPTSLGVAILLGLLAAMWLIFGIATAGRCPVVGDGAV